MSQTPDNSPFSTRELAEVTRLADGTLDPRRRAEVEARIASSSELRELYAQQVKAVGVLHAARASGRAPARLRARIEAERPSEVDVAVERGRTAARLLERWVRPRWR